MTVFGSQGRGGVSIVPRGQARAVQLRPGTAVAPNAFQQRGGGGRSSPAIELVQAMHSSPTALKQSQQEAEEDAKNAAWDEMPFWRKGLATAFDNPVSRTVMAPLNVLSGPQRAIAAGLWNFAGTEAGEGLAKNRALTFGIGGALNAIDADKRTADDRSYWELVKDPSFGGGQMLPETTDNSLANRWMRRAAGFGIDIATDPFTYAGAPASKVAQTAEGAAKVGEEAAIAMERLNNAHRLYEESAKAAELTGHAEDLITATNDARKLTEAGQNYEQLNKAYADALAKVGRPVTVHANRGERLQAVTDLTRSHGNEFVERNKAELERIMQRNYGSAVTPEVREALRLRDPRVTMFGTELPGTARVAEGVQRAGGAVRGGLNRAGLGAMFRAPGEIEDAVKVLVGKQAGTGDTFRAMELVNGYNMMKEGMEVGGRGNSLLRSFNKENLKGKNRSDIAKLLRESEKPGVMTPYNEFFGKMAEVYQKVTGREIRPFMQDPSRYVPHVLTPDARRFLASAEGEKLRKEMNFAVDDLLEGSGYLEKSRKFVPDANGTERVYKIGDRSITVGKGDIEELNQQLGAAFPEFKGQFYQTDPTVIAEAYITSLSKGAGKDLAAKRMAEGASSHVIFNEGEVLQQQAAMDQALSRQSPVYDAISGGYGPTTRDAATRVRPEVPRSEYFQPRIAQKETAQRTKFLRSDAAKAFTKAAKEDIKVRTTGLLEQIKKAREPMLTELRTTAANKVDMEAYHEQIDLLLTTIEEAMTGGNVASRDLVQLATQLDQHMDQLQSRLTMLRDSQGSRLTLAERHARQMLNEEMDIFSKAEDRLVKKLERIDPIYAKAYAEYKQANRPVSSARGSMTRIERNWLAKNAEPEGLEDAQRLIAERANEPEDVLSAGAYSAAEAEGVVDELAVPVEARTLSVADLPDHDPVASRGREASEAQARAVVAAGDAAPAPEELRQASKVIRENEVARRTAAADAERARRAGGSRFDEVSRIERGGQWTVDEGGVWRSSNDAEGRYGVRRSESGTWHILDDGEPINSVRSRPAAQREVDEMLATHAGLADEPAVPAAPTLPHTAEEEAAARATMQRGQIDPEAYGRAKRQLRAAEERKANEAVQLRQLQDAENIRAAEAEQVRLNTLATRGAEDKKAAAAAKRRATRQAKQAESKAQTRAADLAEAQAAVDAHAAWKKAGEDVLVAPRRKLELAEREARRQVKEIGERVGIQIGDDESAADFMARLDEIIGERRQSVERDLTQTQQSQIVRANTEAERVAKARADQQAVDRRIQETGKQQAKDFHTAGVESLEAAERKVEEWDEIATRQTRAAKEMIGNEPALSAASERATWAEDQLKNVASMDKKKRSTIYAIDDNYLGPIRDVVKQMESDPALLSDPTMHQTVGLLDEAAETMRGIADTDMTMKQAKRLINDAFNDKLAPAMLSSLNDNWKLLYEGVPKAGDIMMDAELHKMFQNMFALRKDPSTFGRVFNAFTNLFKTYATLTPGFQVRNSLSGIFMNTSDGVALSHQLSGAREWNKFLKYGEEYLDNLATSDPKMYEAFRATFSTGAGGRYTEAGVGSGATPWSGRLPRAGRAYEKAMNNRFTRAGQRAGERVEGGLRLGMAIDSMMNGQTTQEAIQRIKRIHFDYSEISKFDNSMKQLIPFWTFTSRNLPLQVSQMWTRPRLYLQYQTAVRNLGTAPEENTPEYWLRSGAWNTGAKIGGLPIYVDPDLGFSQAQEQFAQIQEATRGNYGPLLSQGNPIGTAALEYAFRKDLYTGQEFPEGEGFVKPTGPLAPVLQLIAAAVPGGTNKEGQIDPRLINAMRATIPVFDRQMRLIPGLLEAETGQGTNQRVAESWARVLGIPGRVLTSEQQRSEAQRKWYESQDEYRRTQEMAATAAS